MVAPLPNDETSRLAALYRYQILDTAPEPAFDDLAALAAQICDTPIALICLLDHDRQWFKSKIGITASETSRNLAFCAHTILQDQPFIVEDTLNDRCFASNDLVTGEPHIRFYAGVPLTTPTQHRIGTLCVIDRVPRHLQPEQIRALEIISQQVVGQLELRSSLAALQERENQLQAIFNEAPQCIKLVDAAGKLLEMNSAGLSMIEAADRSAAVGQSVYSLIVPEDRSAYRAFNEQICRGEKGVLEFEILGLQGKRKCMESHAVPLQIQPDGPVVHLGITQDITARKQAEKALQQQTNRERLVNEIAQRIRQSLDLNEILNTTVAEVRNFLQADRVLIYRFEPDWSGIIEVESVDPNWNAILNTKIRDSCFQNENYRTTFAQGHVQSNADIHQAGLTPCHVELLTHFQVKSNLTVPILQQDQLWGLLIAHHCSEARLWQPFEIHLLEQLATQVAIAIHQSTLYQQAQTELAERKQAEQKNRDQAALLDVATDAIFAHDLNQRILYWNKGAERLYGWSLQEVENQLTSNLFYQPMPANLHQIYQALFRSGEWHGELTHRTKHHEEVIVESRWTLVRDCCNTSNIVLVVNTDITQKKQLEQQFLRAQRMESIGTLASGIAHDLNNVLAPILMAVALLKSQLELPPESKCDQWLDIIDTSTRRGANLVKQVLSFARGVEGERSLLDVKHLIWELKQMIEEMFPRSISLFTNVASELWVVNGDATQLHQVLLNLCINARDAMPDGGVLQLTARNITLSEGEAQRFLDAQVGRYVVLTVSDTGTGIPSALLNRIFDPFFTTKPVGKGTGLGLSTVMSIVKSHGGFVSVSSQLGKGTHFQVYLPAIVSSETQTAAAAEVFNGENQWILIADDEAAVRELTQTTLEAHGYQVLTARNGIEAIALYAQHKEQIRLALINVFMPAIDGAAAIRTLRTINPALKIIATSGVMTHQQLLNMEIEIQHFLHKPFAVQDLLTTLHQTLNS